MDGGGPWGARLEVFDEFLEALLLLECFEPGGGLAAVASVPPPGLVGAGGGGGAAPRRSSRVPRPPKSGESWGVLEVFGGGRAALGGAGAGLAGGGGSSVSGEEVQVQVRSGQVV